MNLRRLVYAIPFTFMALICVAYAHSQTSDTLELNEQLFRTHHPLQGYCEVRVKTDGDQIVVKPSTESRTAFRGFWPREAGQEELSAVTGSADETLSVRFVKNLRGEIQPEGYVYNYLPSQRQNRLIGPHECSGLQPSN